jgi:hypothetical protein
MWQWLRSQPTKARIGRNRGRQHESQASQQAGSAQQVGSGAQQVGSGAQQVGSGAQQVGSGAQQVGSGAQQAGSQQEPPPHMRLNSPKAWASLALATNNRAKAATTGKNSRVFMNRTPTKEKQGGDFVMRLHSYCCYRRLFHLA